MLKILPLFVKACHMVGFIFVPNGFQLKITVKRQLLFILSLDF